MLSSTYCLIQIFNKTSYFQSYFWLWGCYLPQWYTFWKLHFQETEEEENAVYNEKTIGSLLLVVGKTQVHYNTTNEGALLKNIANFIPIIK